MYKVLIRPLLFLFPAETAHTITFRLLKILFFLPGMKYFFRSLFHFRHPSLRREVFGISFPNPVGLAAGFDKDAKLIDAFAEMGFGFIEIGTTTPLPQAGNPTPRLFRLKKDEGIINRMGFNNAGVEATIQRLKARKSRVIVGGNIGKNKITPNETAENDYLICFEKLFPYVDYFVLNVSSPNTPNLRELQEKQPLTNLLSKLQAVNLAKETPKPILLKIAPDLTESQLDDIVEIVSATKIAGIIATNTTLSREGLVENPSSLSKIGAGGLSGRPLRERSTEVIKYLFKKSNGSFPIIAVGGIFSAADAKEKLAAGASLVQVYTGFIYEGPSLVHAINRALVP